MRSTTLEETKNIIATAEDVKRFKHGLSYKMVGADNEGFLLLDLTNVTKYPDSIFKISDEEDGMPWEFKCLKSNESFSNPTFKIEDLTYYAEHGAAVIVVQTFDDKPLRWCYFGPEFIKGLSEEATGQNPGSWKPYVIDDRFGGKDIVTIKEDEFNMLLAYEIITSRRYASNFKWIEAKDRKVTRAEMGHLLRGMGHG